MCAKTIRLVTKMRAASLSFRSFRRKISSPLTSQRTFSSRNVKTLWKTFNQSLSAFVMNLLGLVAGGLVAFYFGLFSKEPWIILLYPAILSSRGVIGGLLCGRLSTGLHLGVIYPKFVGNTRRFYSLIQALIVLAFLSAFFTSLVAFLFTYVLWGVSPAAFTSILFFVVATMALSILLVSPLTIGISFLSFKTGLDPDVVLYPIQSSTADVLVTFCYVSVLTLFFSYGFLGWMVILAICFVFALLAIYSMVKNFSDLSFAKTLREAFFVIVLVSLIVNVTGSFLGQIRRIIGNVPEIYVVYPALNSTIGDLGAVVGSTATTKLALGTLDSSFLSIKGHVAEITGSWAASVIMFSAFSVFAVVVQGGVPPFFSTYLLSLLLLTNVIAAFCMILISYAVGIITFQKGLDPDNFVIPIESSLADTMTTLALLIALTLIG